MSITDMIKFKIKEVFRIRKTVVLPDPPPPTPDPHCSALDHWGLTAPSPQTPDCFSKTTMPKFCLDTSLHKYKISNIYQI